jgi:hypothetical protein
MKTWIKRIARILAIGVFFGVFLAGINPDNPLDVTNGLWALAKALVGFAVFWIAGYILGDIIFKGVVESVGTDDVPLYEGGLIQRVKEEKLKQDPDAKALKPKINPLLKKKMGLAKEGKQGVEKSKEAKPNANAAEKAVAAPAQKK